ncbi:glycosyltransferase [Chromobacterium piscinae]
MSNSIENVYLDRIMESVPKISIVVPVYNASDYIDLLMESLLSQDVVNMEIIAVNDGSTDDSLSILKKWSCFDSRITVLNISNGGPSRARNIGMNYARGEWLYFVDADDWVAPETLKCWIYLAEKNNVDFLLGNAFSFENEPTGEHRNIFIKQPWGRCISGEDWIIHAVAQAEWPHYCWLQFIRRDFLIHHDITYPEDILHEDILWTMNLSLAAKCIYFDVTPRYGYRCNQQSIMNVSTPTAIAKRINGYIFLIDRIVQIGTEKRGDLRKAILLQANRECGHLLGLFRKRLHDKELKSFLAHVALRKVPFKLLLYEARSFKEVWRIMRMWLLLKKYL